MFKKFHWGHGITVFMVLFIGTLVFVVIAMSRQDPGLVQDNYYDLDLKYQKRFDGKQNSKDHSDLTIEYKSTKNSILIDFHTDKKIEGSILFFRPSNKKDDFTIPIDVNIIEVPTEKLSRGLWRIKIEWEQETKVFYKEKDIYI